MAILKGKFKKKIVDVTIILSVLTGGGLIAIFSFLNDYSDSKFSRKLLSNPNWQIIIDYNERNSLYDVVNIEPKNENINIINMEMKYYIKDSVVSINDYKSIINTQEFKESIINDVIEMNASFSNINPENTSLRYQIPVVFKIGYEFLGEKLTDIRLYKYNFQLTVTRDKYFLESVDFDFIKVLNSSNTLKKDLILGYLLCNNDYGAGNIQYVVLELAKLNPVFEVAAKFHIATRLMHTTVIRDEDMSDKRLGSQFDREKGLLYSSYDSLDRFGRDGYYYLYNLNFTKFYQAWIDVQESMEFIGNNQNLYNYEIINSIPEIINLGYSFYEDKDDSLIFHTDSSAIYFSLAEAYGFEENDYYLKKKYDSLHNQIFIGIKKLIDFENIEKEALKEIE